MEDKHVADRLIKIWPNIVKLFKFWNGLQPKSKSYMNVKDVIGDVLYPAKLSFFSCVAGLMQPFVLRYQTDNPMIPFLHDDLFSLLFSLLQLIVTPDILDKIKAMSELKNIDLDKKENLLKGNQFDIGFAANQLICELKGEGSVASTDVTALRKECL